MCLHFSVLLILELLLDLQFKYQVEVGVLNNSDNITALRFIQVESVRTRRILGTFWYDVKNSTANRLMNQE